MSVSNGRDMYAGKRKANTTGTSATVTDLANQAKTGMGRGRLLQRARGGDKAAAAALAPYYSDGLTGASRHGSGRDGA